MGGDATALQSKQQSTVEVAFAPADHVTRTSIFAGCRPEADVFAQKL
jgi:hypothetical protein